MFVVSKDLIDKFTDCLAFGRTLSEGTGKTLDGWSNGFANCCLAYRSYQQHQDFLKTLDLSEYKKTGAEGNIEAPYLVGICTVGRDGNQHRWCNMQETLFVDKYNKVTSLVKPEGVYAIGGILSNLSTDYRVKTGGLCSMLTSELKNSSIDVRGSLSLSRSRLIDSSIDVKGNCVIAGAYLEHTYIKADCDVYILGGTLNNVRVLTSTPLVLYADTWSRDDRLIACSSGAASCISTSELYVGKSCTVEISTVNTGIYGSILDLKDSSGTLINGFGLCRETITNSGQLSILMPSRAGYSTRSTIVNAHKTVAAGAKLRVRLLDKGYIGNLRVDEDSCCSLTTNDKICTVWVRKGRSAAIASSAGNSHYRKVLVV